MKFSPSENYLLVAKEVPVEPQGGIIKVGAANTVTIASVVEVGPHRSPDDRIYFATDIVVFQQHLAIPIKCDNTSAEEHFIIRKEHILGKMLS